VVFKKTPWNFSWEKTDHVGRKRDGRKWGCLREVEKAGGQNIEDGKKKKRKGRGEKREILGSLRLGKKITHRTD